ncbi:hypothetical protein OEZ86_010353 [Tetradesmus obliquus]|nr:hypothetical protein OEZ86_010353 [Tetradesmus obliquus]
MHADVQRNDVKETTGTGTESNKSDEARRLCPPGCLVCQAPAGKAGTPSRVPRQKRACVCCPPGRVPHETNPAACRLCLPGSIAPATGSLKCEKCSEGFTTPKPSRTACSGSRQLPISQHHRPSL